MTGFQKRVVVAATAGALALAQMSIALALPAAPLPETDAGLTQIRGGFHGGGNFHGGGWHGGGGNHGGGWNGGGNWGRPGYRPPAGGWHGGHWHGGAVRPPVYGAWRRPYYGWNPGGAIAAGAAIGFLSAAAAAAYANSAAPAAGLCWYYTDASYTSGFWDYCP